MQGQQEWARPEWFARYMAQQGSFSTLDNGTLAFLSTNFNCLPVLLVPVDYSLPLGGGGALALAVPPVPLPEACAHQALGLAETGLSLQELEGVLGGAASSQEAELWELSQCFSGLTVTAKQEALATVAKQLSFPTDPPTAPSAPSMPALHHTKTAAASAPGLAVYSDPPLAAAPTSATGGAAGPRRPAALADRTNLPAGGAAKQMMQQLSSKLHVAHSQKMPLPELPADEVKALLSYQLQAAEPIRPAWFRNSHHVPTSKRGGGGAGGASRALKQQAAAPSPTGTGVYVPMTSANSP